MPKLKRGTSTHLRQVDGKFLPKLTPAQVSAIRSGYPQLSNSAVAAKFGISRVMAHYYRTGQRGVIATGNAGPAISRLGPIRGRDQQGQIEIAVKFLARAVPLLRNLLRAEAELRARGSTEVALDEPIRERWHEHVEPAETEPRERTSRAEEARALAARQAVERAAEPDPEQPDGNAPGDRAGWWSGTGPVLQD